MMSDREDSTRRGTAPARAASTARGTATVRLSVFGPLTEVLESAELELELALPATAEGLREELAQLRPSLSGHRFQIAVDERIVRGSDRVESAREIALLPPFAGG